MNAIKILCGYSAEASCHILFDMRAILERYYTNYEECVNIGPEMTAHGRMGPGVDLKRRFLV